MLRTNSTGKIREKIFNSFRKFFDFREIKKDEFEAELISRRDDKLCLEMIGHFVPEMSPDLAMIGKGGDQANRHTRRTFGVRRFQPNSSRDH